MKRYVVIVWMHDHWGVTWSGDDLTEAIRVRDCACAKVAAVLVDTQYELSNPLQNDTSEADNG